MLKLYRSCSSCPIKNFIEVIESGDVRHILKLDDYDVLPDEYPDETVDVWNGIIDEYTQLSNNTRYTGQINKQSAILKDINRINTVLAAIRILKHGSIVADDALKYFGYEFNDFTELQSTINKLIGEKTRLEIRKAQLDVQPKGKTDFYKLVAQAEKERGVGIDVNKVTVKQWCAIINNLEDGRKDKQK